MHSPNYKACSRRLWTVNSAARLFSNGSVSEMLSENSLSGCKVDWWLWLP